MATLHGGLLTYKEEAIGLINGHNTDGIRANYEHKK